MCETETNLYKSGWDHLNAELSKLDALLHLRLLDFGEEGAVTNPGIFRGLYIAEEEVHGMVDKRETKVSGEEPARDSRRKALVAHINELRERIAEKVENSLKAGINLPLYHLATVFPLNSFELDILLICLAPELESKYEKIYAYLQDDVTKNSPSVNLLLDLLCSSREEKIAARCHFLPQAPLFRYHLLHYIVNNGQPAKPLLSRCLKLDDRLVNLLLGIQGVDSGLVSLTRLIIPQRDWSTIILKKGLKEQLSRLAKAYFQELQHRRLIFYFCGPYGAGKKSAAEAFCRKVGLSLLVSDMREIISRAAVPVTVSEQDPGTEPAFEKIVRSLFRESLLQPAAIYIDNFDLLPGDETRKTYHQKIILKASEDFSVLTFLAGEKALESKKTVPATLLEFDFQVPDCTMRKQLWQLFLNDGRQIEISRDVRIETLANKFQLTGGQIRDALKCALDLVMMKGDNSKNEITIDDLYWCCRSQSNRKLSEVTCKINPHYCWSDIVLPSEELQQLKEIFNHVKYRQKVFYEWGFESKLSSGKGLNILFCGPSGTGKTMAADIIAHELSLDLYKIDLSCVVSKYIGETEKNLASIFREAETSNAILFFDEADALFGKRSEVKDSHDRYANIEIGYLLQKMEEYKGVVILATNMRKNMDEAFVRRMHFTVEFPFPDENYRLRIWENIFPQETPLDKNIDFDFLKQNFKVTGGNIKNIALTAAFYAADNGQAVTMEHLVLAGKREFQKMGKLCIKEDFGQYYELIK